MDYYRAIFEKLINIMITEKTMKNPVIFLILFDNKTKTIKKSSILDAEYKQFLPNLQVIDEDLKYDENLLEFMKIYGEFYTCGYNFINRKNNLNIYIHSYTHNFKYYNFKINKNIITYTNIHKHIELIKSEMRKLFCPKYIFSNYEFYKHMFYIITNIFNIEYDYNSINKDFDFTEMVVSKFTHEDYLIYDKYNNIIENEIINKHYEVY